MAPAMRVAARRASRAGSAPPQQWRSGVILGNGHIGDVLFRTCSLELLKRGLPDCDWSYLTTPLAATALAGNPSLFEVLPWSLDSGAEPPAPGRYVDLAARRFDVALCSENAAHYRALLLALRLGIPNRVAFVQKGLSGLATQGVQLSGPLPHAMQFRRMVEQITGIRDASPLRPRIFPSAEDASAADHEWIRLGLNDAEFVIACSATTRQESSACQPELFIDVLRHALSMAPTARVVLSGVSQDGPLLRSIANALGTRAAVSAGVLTVLQYGSLLRRCSVFIGPDSGARHLANAADIPVFFVRNMGSGAIDTGVYCDSETDIAPAGEYLSVSAARRAMARIDCNAVATALVAAGRGQARDKPEGTPR
jgi:heptosyltransferase-2